MSNLIQHAALNIGLSVFNNWAFDIGADQKATAAWAATTTAISSVVSPLLATFVGGSAGLLANSLSASPAVTITTTFAAAAIASVAGMILSSEASTDINKSISDTPIKKEQSRKLLAINTVEAGVLGGILGAALVSAGNHTIR